MGKRFNWLIVDGNGALTGTNDEQVARDLATEDDDAVVIEVSATGESEQKDQDFDSVSIDEA
jgi:hypothetical protein